MDVAKEMPWPVAAGLEIVDEAGFDAVSVRAVAARAGYTPMAVYRHVSDVDELLRRVVRCVFEDWESRVYAVLDEPDPVARLRRYGEIYSEYGRVHTHRYDLLFVIPHGIGTHRFPKRPAEEGATTFRILEDAVREAMTSGILEEGDPSEVALGLWATAHGLVMLERSGRFPDPTAFEEFFRRTIDRLLNGIRVG